MTLEDLGLNAKVIIAGFSGGVVHAIVFKQRDPIVVSGSVVTGTLTANYLTPFAAHYVGAWIDSGAGGFIVGLTAMAICQGLVALVSARLRSEVGQEKVTKETRP